MINYFSLSHIGLHFKLEDRHLNTSPSQLSFTIECRTLQMWPVDRLVDEETISEHQKNPNNITENEIFDDIDGDNYKRLEHEKKDTNFSQFLPTSTTTNHKVSTSSFRVGSTKKIATTTITSKKPFTTITTITNKNQTPISLATTTTTTTNNNNNEAKINYLTTLPSVHQRAKENLTMENKSKDFNNSTTIITSSYFTTDTTTYTTIESTMNNSQSIELKEKKSFLDSIRQFNKNHPQVITSFKLTLIPIVAITTVFFWF